MSRLLPAALVVAFLLALPATACAIVGGGPATQAYPHMAAMYYDPPEDEGEEDTGYRFRCGASLIRPDWILTAAHCVHTELNDGDDEEDVIPPERIRYLIGTQKRSEGGETIQADKVFVHESYHDPFFFSHDVSLVHLRNSTTKGTPIRVGTQAERDPYWAPGVTARVIGWGTDAPQVGSVQDELQEVDIPIVDDTDCHLSYPSEFLIGEFEPLTMICAGETQGTKDSCQGDSGGPLMTKDATGAFMQVGIVSWGAFCALPTQYGVYSRAAGQTLRTWIDEQLAANTATSPGPAPPQSEPLPAPSPTAPPVLPAGAGSAEAPPKDVTAIVFRKVRKGRRLEIGCRLRGATLRACQVEVLVKRRGKLRRLRTLTLDAGKTGVIRQGRVRKLILNGVLLATDGNRYRVRRTIRRTT